jgi:MEDS: MEthanogen/methylotroph, DcmR Sensory domain
MPTAIAWYDRQQESARPMPSTSTEVQPVHLGGATLERSRHVCAFFGSSEEEYRVLLPFITEGIERGEKAFHIVDPDLRRQHLDRLEQAGVDTTAAQQRGQLEVRVWAEAYLREGHFDQNAMLALIEQVLREGRAQGFPLTRLVAHMEWALEDRPGVDDLVEYETRLNYVLPHYPDPVI